MQTVVFIVCLFIIGKFLFPLFKKRKPLLQPAIETEKQLLQQHVAFYRELPTEEKIRFELSLRKFLDKVRITGIKTTVEDLDRTLVASAAIIPIFAFTGWEYRNIHEVLIYPDSFNEDFRLTGKGRDTLGMVGNGAMQDVMIISKQDLRNGFLNNNGTFNTAIHEFVHLIDKADGSIDGLPEYLLQHQYAIPWLKRMHKEMELIKSSHSDINPYGATNETEFLAVAAEYFFKNPHLMKEKHPQLFTLLQQIFRP